jgi:nucleoside-diphosphate-sugar epimerase
VTAGFTVIGSSGFIGSRLVRHLEAGGHACWAPRRGEPLVGRALGHVIYCGGLTGDWGSRRRETIQAHVETPAAIAAEATFDSLLYLSSTRVYDRHPGPLACEEDGLLVKPDVTADMYALSKAAGESVVLAAGGRVARLSHVYGPTMARHGFLSTVLRDAVNPGRVQFESSLDSVRDFVSVADVVGLLARVAVDGRERIYNIASGALVSNAELSNALSRLTGCAVTVSPGARQRSDTSVSTERIRDEFGFAPGRLLDDLPALVAAERS